MRLLHGVCMIVITVILNSDLGSQNRKINIK